MAAVRRRHDFPAGDIESRRIFAGAQPRLEPVTTRRRCLPRHEGGNDPPGLVCTCPRRGRSRSPAP